MPIVVRICSPREEGKNTFSSTQWTKWHLFYLLSFEIYNIIIIGSYLLEAHSSEHLLIIFVIKPITTKISRWLNYEKQQIRKVLIV